MVRRGVSLGAGWLLWVLALLVGAPVGSRSGGVGPGAVSHPRDPVVPATTGGLLVGSGDPDSPGWRWHRRTHPRR